MSTGPKTEEGKATSSVNGVKHGAYAAKLRALLTPDEQELFDVVPRSTDLSEEIRLSRIRVLRFQAMLARGEKFITTDGKSKSFSQTGESYSESAWSVEELLEKSLDSLRKLIATQHSMNPGAGVSGNLRLTVSVTQDAKDAADAATPNLEAGERDPAHAGDVPSLEAPADEARSPGDDLLEDLDGP